MIGKIKVIGTIHDTHKTNKNYTFVHLYDAIKAFDPEIIGVEIRQQDMKESNDYLGAYYPPEMVEVKAMYEKQIEVFGFDWRGKQIENRKIEDWRTMVPQLWTLMEKEEVFKKFVDERRALMHPFFETCTMEACQKGYDPKIEKAMSDKLDHLLVEYGHEYLIDYYNEREDRIQRNIMDKIEKNSNKRLLILTGCSHRRALVDRINSDLGYKTE